MARIFGNLALSLIILLILSGCVTRSGEKDVPYLETLLKKGNFAAVNLEASRLKSSSDLSGTERIRIDSLLETMARIRLDFTLTDSDVIKKMVKYNPGFDTKELLRLEKEHKIDFLILDGKKYYFKNCIGNIFRLDSSYNWLKFQKEGSEPDLISKFRVTDLTEILKNTQQFGQLVNPVRMRLSYTITVAPDAVPPGEIIRCWMPFPRENHPRQQNVKLLQTEPIQNRLSPASDFQRSLYHEKISTAHQPTVFHSEILFTSYAQSFRLTPEMMKPYQTNDLLYQVYVAERPPQIIFNDKIKSLAKKILQNETNPLLKVRKIYRWINDSVTWASALEYGIMSDIPGFVMENRHGDCGMQTLLFMTLARYAGVPVKWQSGWMLHPGAVNLHDWCEIWYEGYGWIPLDQSFGLQDSQEPLVRDYYISGIDAYRLIVNDDISQPFTPDKKFFRSEPYDFQRGEVEWNGGNLYFDKWSWHMEVSYEKDKETIRR